jgi:hypothetical protein
MLSVYRMLCNLLTEVFITLGFSDLAAPAP